MLPVFVDEDGTRCAMAHLIEPTAPDLVQHIAGARNVERVRTLADIPELARWLEDNGLTLEEAMAIQPSYCGDQTERVCHPGGTCDDAEGCSSGGVAGAGHASLVAGLIAGAGALTALRRLRRR
jgi:hypothetical protein